MASAATILHIRAPEDMARLGAVMASVLPAGSLVFLAGELGAGKTTLARGLIQHLLPGTKVKSPTFTLVEPYAEAQPAIYHFDLYRLSDPEELEFMGLRDYLQDDAICLVEWPEKGQGMLPVPDLRVLIEYEGEGRRVRLEAEDAALLSRLTQLFSNSTVIR